MRYLLVLALLLGAASAYAGDSQDQQHGSQGDGRGGPEVYDAQGKYIGPLVESNFGDGVYLTINGAVTFVPINRVSGSTTASATQFQWSGSGPAVFSSSDCSGPPILSVNSWARPSMAIRRGADVVLYVAGDAGSRPLAAGSERMPPNLDVCLPIVVDMPDSFAAQTTYPLTQAYPEPLSIRP